MRNENSEKTKNKTNFGKPDFHIEKYKNPVVFEDKLDTKKLSVQKENMLKNDENSIFNEFYSFVNKMLLFWSLERREFIGYTPSFGQSLIQKIVRAGHFNDLQQFFREAVFEDELDHRIINGTEQLLIKYGENNRISFDLACSSGMSSLLLLYYWLEDIADSKKMSFLCVY